MGSGKGQIGGSEVRREMLQMKVVISGTTSLVWFCLVLVLGSPAWNGAGKERCWRGRQPSHKFTPNMSPFKMKTALKMTPFFLSSDFYSFLFLATRILEKVLENPEGNEVITLTTGNG